MRTQQGPAQSSLAVLARASLARLVRGAAMTGALLVLTDSPGAQQNDSRTGAEPPKHRPSLLGPAACGALSPAYRGAGELRVLLLRWGTIKKNNPLRPSAVGSHKIWHVAVGRQDGFLEELADGTLVEIPSIRDLEEMNENSVRWTREFAGIATPSELRTHAGQTLGKLTFSGCEPTPTFARAPASRPATRRSEKAAPEADGREQRPLPSPPSSGHSLPQGAIPE